MSIILIASLLLSPVVQADTLYKRDGTRLTNVQVRITRKLIIVRDARGRITRLPITSVRRIVRGKIKRKPAPVTPRVKIIKVKTEKSVSPGLNTVPRNDENKRSYLLGLIPGWSGFYHQGRYKTGMFFSILEIVAAYYIAPWIKTGKEARQKAQSDTDLGVSYLGNVARNSSTITQAYSLINIPDTNQKVTRAGYKRSFIEKVMPELLVAQGKLISESKYNNIRAQYLVSYLLLLTADVLAAWYFNKPRTKTVKKAKPTGPGFNLSILPGPNSSVKMGISIRF